jgi:hypothetical protein
LDFDCVPTFAKKRLFLTLLIAGVLFLGAPQHAASQDDPGETPLGDVARNFRKRTATPEEVIDNDNLSKVVEDAESHRASGSTMVFSLDPGGRNLRVSTPDVSCSLSFSAKTSALLSDPLMLDELPREELSKLQGPATLEGDSLQLSIHNGTDWELREVVVGLTIVRTPSPIDAVSSYGPARIMPVVAGATTRAASDSNEKQPDSTVLLRVKGSAAPSATAVFRTQLNFALFPDQEWHWAIVRAKGVPPQTQNDPATATTQSQTPDAATTGAAPPGTPTVPAPLQIPVQGQGLTPPDPNH